MSNQHKMFFVFGSPRSGTTLLAQCLNAHDEIVVPFETDFIVPMAFLFDRLPDPDIGRELIAKMIAHSARFAESIGIYLTPDEIEELVYSVEYHPASILKEVYRRISEKTGCRVSGDKSPNDLLRLRILVKTGTITSDTLILHIVRDIRDVMVSLKHTGWVKDLDLYFPRMWSNSNLYLHVLYRNHPSQYLLIRYEDFVRSPEEKLKEICAFLGVPFQAKMLSPEHRDPRYKRMRHHRNLFRPITPTRIGVYQRKLDWKTISLYESQAREAMLTFGYKPETIGLASYFRQMRNLFGK